MTVADIGITGGSPSMFIAEEGDAPRPGRARKAHKWSAGAVLVAGGSAGLVGAAILAARSALSFGAGTVYFATDDHLTFQRLVPEIPVLDPQQALADLSRFDVIVAGPGLADADRAAVRPILEKASRVVLDAGGITPELIEAASQDNGKVTITPHAGEYSRLTGRGAGSYSIRAYARDRNLTVLLKGNPTQISDGGPPILVRTGGPELASIGTGDVLAGMIGALWSRGLDSTTAAISGAYWHGRAGADLGSKGTVTADKLADHIASYAW